MKHLRTFKDLDRDTIFRLMSAGQDIKKNPEKYANRLHRKIMLMLFEKPSLRTRLSFEIGMYQLGGHAIFYSAKDSPLGQKESIEDTAKVAGRMVDIIMARVFKQEHIEALATYSGVPVINGLSDFEHPCQILCDFQTIIEKFGKLEGLTLAYLGDSFNNVTHSLLYGCSMVGMNIRVGCPTGAEYEPSPDVLKDVKAFAAKNGSKVEVVHSAMEAVASAHVVYADSWMSYHITKDKEAERIRIFKPFQINEQVMKNAAKNAVFMNCLPAMRGYEQTAEVIDGPQSIVFDQAENRLHQQKAIVLYLMDKLDEKKPSVKAKTSVQKEKLAMKKASTASKKSKAPLPKKGAPKKRK
ncbi:MAG: ornithine carbamoyltransferase [Planctomycetota bacterium]